MVILNTVEKQNLYTKPTGTPKIQRKFFHSTPSKEEGKSVQNAENH